MLRKSGPPQLKSAVREGDFYAAHEFLLSEADLTIAHSSLYKYVMERRAREHERHLTGWVRENQLQEVAVQPIELDDSPDAVLRDLDDFDHRDRESRLNVLRKIFDYPNHDKSYFGLFRPTSDADPGPYFYVSAEITDLEVQMIADTAYELRGLTGYEDKSLPRRVRQTVYDVGNIAVARS